MLAIASIHVAMAIVTVAFNLVYAIPALWDVFGKCVAMYLKGTLLVSQSACVCDAGRGGPACDQNPCLKLLWTWGVCVSGRHRLAVLMCFWLLR